MDTKLFNIEDIKADHRYIEEAAQTIRDGGLVAFPTETVYGLGGDATNPLSSKKIYAAKGRPSDNPLIVHIAQFEQLQQICDDIPDIAVRLAGRFWPGPLTMILKKNNVIPDETTGGLDTVAVRMPSNEIALELIRTSGCMIAAPSANSSGKPSTTTATHVYNDLSGKIDIILNGGASVIGLESTIVDLTESVPVILRPGAITKAMLQQEVGPVKMDPGLDSDDESVKPKAPGMRYKHYAPDANLTLVEGSPRQVVSFINSNTERLHEQGIRVGVIATSQNASQYIADTVKIIGDREDEDYIASVLYSVLREFDKTDVDQIYCEMLSDDGIGYAIKNRLLRAAGGEIVNVEALDIDRIIFVGKNGTGRAPMAAAILRKQFEGDESMDILSRGLLVQFPKPLNQQIEAVLATHGINWPDFRAIEITDDDITEKTLIFVMEQSHRDKLISKLSKADEYNTYVLSDFVGDELDIMNPFGGNMQIYGLCYELINETINKLTKRLRGEDYERKET